MSIQYYNILQLYLVYWVVLIYLFELEDFTGHSSLQYNKIWFVFVQILPWNVVFSTYCPVNKLSYSVMASKALSFFFRRALLRGQ